MYCKHFYHQTLIISNVIITILGYWSKILKYLNNMYFFPATKFYLKNLAFFHNSGMTVIFSSIKIFLIFRVSIRLDIKPLSMCCHKRARQFKQGLHSVTHWPLKYIILIIVKTLYTMFAAWVNYHQDLITVMIYAHSQAISILQVNTMKLHFPFLYYSLVN